MKSFLLSLALTLGLALPAGVAAASGPVLKPSVVVEANVVSLGDLFDRAGETANVTLFAAPRPGERTALSADEVYELALAHGLDWRPTPGMGPIVIERASQTITTDDILHRLSDAFVEAGIEGPFAIDLANRNLSILVAVDQPAILGVEKLNVDERATRFSAVLVAPAGDPAARRIRVAGRINRLAEVPVLRRRIGAGDIIRATDIDWIEMRVDRIGRDIITEQDDLIGMSPRRPIRPDRPVRASNVELPILVVKNSTVTMVYRTPALLLTLIGRAIEDGALGEGVRVMNTRTKVVVQATVTGKDTVTIPSPYQIGLR